MTMKIKNINKHLYLAGLAVIFALTIFLLVPSSAKAGGGSASVSPSYAMPGEHVTVSWSGLWDYDLRYTWAAFFRVSDPMPPDVWGDPWWYLGSTMHSSNTGGFCDQQWNGPDAPSSGSCTFVVPSWTAVGQQYNFRFFGNDSYDNYLTTTNTLTIGNNNANYISFSNIPSLVAPGQVFSVSITMRNTGTSTWTCCNYKLGDPRDGSSPFSPTRVVVPSSVSPNTDVTFTFAVTAPSTMGQYSFQWRMVLEGVAWFGGLTPQFVINVANVPSCTNATPDDDIVTTTSGNRTTYANGVNNATAVVFKTWDSAQGEANAVSYSGVNLGGGIWRTDIPLASHPAYGTIRVDVIMSNIGYPSQYCDSANFIRSKTGTVQVRSNIDTSWTLSGPNGFSDSVTNLSSKDYVNLLEGSYLLSPAAKEGYDVTVTPINPQTLE
jgi:hypothetical protein